MKQWNLHHPDDIFGCNNGDKLSSTLLSESLSVETTKTQLRFERQKEKVAHDHALFSKNRKLTFALTKNLIRVHIFHFLFLNNGQEDESKESKEWSNFEWYNKRS